MYDLIIDRLIKEKRKIKNIQVMINCILIDDEPHALEILKTYIEKVPYLNFVAGYTDAIRALTEVTNLAPDVIFCDIEMPDINGLQFVESLRMPRKPLFVMVSAHEQYAIEGFNLDVLDYLLKPVSFSRFLKTAQKLQDQLRIQNSSHENSSEPHFQSDETIDSYIFVKSNNKLLKINYDKILYIESLSDYIKIYTEDSQRPILSLSSLKSLEEKLPSHLFKRIHRSYIVALSKIKAIEHKKVLIGDRASLPISNSYYDNFFNTLISNNILK